MKNFFRTAGEIIKDFATHNLGLKVASLVCAFLIWCFVVAGTNPDRVKTVNNVPLRVEGIEELEAKDLCIDNFLSEIPEEVSVNVEAGVDYHNLISNSTVTATLNLASINEAGEVSVNINCSAGSSGGRVASVIPSTVKLVVDDLSQKTIPVVVKVTEGVSDGYYLSSIKARHDEITIIGAHKRISQVAKAVAYVDASDITESDTFAAPVTLLDKDGDELENITSNDDNLYATISCEVLSMKEIKVSTESVINSVVNVARGYEIYGAVTAPKTIRIAGDPEALKGITDLQFDIIDAGGADKSVVLDAVLKDIPDVLFIDGNEVVIFAQIREIQEEKVFSDVPINIRNLPVGYTAMIEGDDTVTVDISGGASAVNNIYREDIEVYIDLTSATEGRTIKGIKVDDIIGVSESGISLSKDKVYVVLKKK